MRSGCVRVKRRSVEEWTSECGGEGEEVNRGEERDEESEVNIDTDDLSCVGGSRDFAVSPYSSINFPFTTSAGYGASST